MANNILVGYARVSTASQSLDIQIQQLNDYASRQGCEIEIFSEVHSVKSNEKDCKYPLYVTRPILFKAIERAKKLHSPIVVTYIDRLARTKAMGEKILDEYSEYRVLFERVNCREDAMLSFEKAEDENKHRSTKVKNALAVKKQAICDNIYEELGDYSYIWHKATFNSPKFKAAKMCFQETMIEDAIDDFCFSSDELANGIPKADCDKVVSYIIDGMIQDEKYQKTLHRYMADNSKKEAEVISPL